MHNRLTKFSLLDEVSLKWEFDYEDEGGAGTLPPGTKGVIVEIFEKSNLCIVEFFDNEVNSEGFYDSYIVDIYLSQLELTKKDVP